MTTIPLDYDDLPPLAVYSDALYMLMDLFEPGDSVIIKESSRLHYHVVFTTDRELSFEECLAVARRSSCSRGYLDRVKTLRYFCIRTSKKSDGKPEPKTILRMVKGG